MHVGVCEHYGSRDCQSWRAGVLTYEEVNQAGQGHKHSQASASAALVRLTLSTRRASLSTHTDSVLRLPSS